jgi:hypothetical protein
METVAGVPDVARGNEFAWLSGAFNGGSQFAKKKKKKKRNKYMFSILQ